MSFRAMRVRAGLSVPKVMEALGVSDAAVYQWESGANTPRVKTLPKIAKLYGCTIEELLDDDEQ